MRKRCRKFSCLHMSVTLRSKNSSSNPQGVDTDELSQVMNSDSICNLMKDKRLLRNQPKEPYDIESRDYGRTCSVCNSNIISPRVLPSSYYYPSMYICNSSDWDICEELRLRELEEAKARAAQMEKTMRWWSDCTANWREKWSKVRAERNKAFEEGRQLKLKLEALMKDLNVLKKINQGLISRNEEMEAKTTWKKNFGSSEICWMKEDRLGNLEKEPIKHLQNNILEVESGCQEICATLDHHEMRINPEIIDCEDKSTPVLMGKSKDKPTLSHDDEIIPISVFCLHLYESQKILQKEKKIRSSLEKEIEKVRSEKSLWKLKYEELRESMQGSLKQFTVHKDLHQTEVETIVEDLEDATGARCQKDIKIWELQAQLERLQSESESEWERRKILETEKQELDRENRRLKTKLKDLQDLLDRKSIIPAVHLCGDLMNSHSEPLQENKGSPDMMQHNGQLNKQEPETLAELGTHEKEWKSIKQKQRRSEDIRTRKPGASYGQARVIEQKIWYFPDNMENSNGSKLRFEITFLSPAKRR